MASTLTNLLFHVVFSTKGRASQITNEIRSDLEQYLGGIIRMESGVAFDISCPRNHAHLVLRLPANRAISDIVRVIKTNSSRWLNQKKGNAEKFAWQSGYAAFSISESLLPEVRAYVRNQDEHHHKRTFQEELRLLLEKHKIEFDERYIWD